MPRRSDTLFDDEVGRAGGTGPSRHAATTYRASRERGGLALCLSGGGFRAALFHLGAVRRLSELGILSKITTISSVSGGSILAAHLATVLEPWPRPGDTTAGWDERIERPFHEFARQNLRTGAILRRLLPWNWLRSSTAVTTLMRRYERDLSGLPLSRLPERPTFVLSATDMAFGVNWTFEKGRAGDYQIGYLEPPPARWKLARAVAASSCFPPVFNPLPVERSHDAYRKGKAPLVARKSAARDLRLTDGGVYDNLGLEPVWKNHGTVLVSDGGATFEPEPDRGLFRRLKRYADIVGNQVNALRKRWLISSLISGELSGAYWGVGSLVEHYDLPGHPAYPADLVENVISEVRTDLDAFSEAEIKVLVNHGYLLADAAISKHQAKLIGVSPKPELDIPYPEWMDEGKVRDALRNSHKRKLLGRR
jgi:NTE family protein